MNVTEQAINDYKERMENEGKFAWSDQFDEHGIAGLARILAQEGIQVTHIKPKGELQLSYDSSFTYGEKHFKIAPAEMLMLVAKFIGENVSEIKLQKSRCVVQLNLGTPIKRDRVK